MMEPVVKEVEGSPMAPGGVSAVASFAAQYPFPLDPFQVEALEALARGESVLVADLRFMVLDEVHYLQDPYRGAVWEEVIIPLPLDVKIVSLSATVSNAEEFADWIQTLRGTTTAIIEERRPVSLEHHYLSDEGLLPMFVQDGDEVLPNPHIRRVEARLDRPRPRGRGRGRNTLPHRPLRRTPRRTARVDVLPGDGMRPAIHFI